MDEKDRRPVMDVLENRLMLAAAPVPAMAGGMLQVIGTATADNITISVDARRTSKLNVAVNGVGYKFTHALVTRIKVKAGGGNDRLIIDETNGKISVPAALLGQVGNDTLQGASGADTLSGWVGDDYLYGGAGNDSAMGDDGNDTIGGQAGNDTLEGALGNDSITGDDGNDIIVDAAGTNALDGSAGTDTINGVVDPATPPPPPPPTPSADQPDLQVKIRADSIYYGDNIYNTTGANQGKSADIAFYPNIYHLRVQNDGKTNDTFTITAAPGGVDWNVKFYDSQVQGWSGGTVITNAVTTTGWSTGLLAPGTYKDFRVEISPRATARGNAWKPVFITAKSTNNPSKIDTVSAAAKLLPQQLVEIRRQNFDDTGIALMTVQNMGNLDDRIKLTGPADGTGFAVRYFDSQWGGSDITAAVTGAGYVSANVAPGSAIPVRVVIDATDGQEHSITLTATSANNAAKIDTTLISNRNNNAAPPGFFVFGVWSQPAGSFDKWKARGINTMVMYESASATIDEWTQAAVDRGLYMIRQPRPNIAADVNQPNLLAWAQPDEPDIGTKNPSSKIVANYNLWKSYGPNIPIWTNFSGGWVSNWQGSFTPEYYKAFMPGTDWGSTCIYPVTAWDHPELLDMPGRVLDRVEKWSNGQVQFAVIENDDQELPWGGRDLPSPNPVQFRAEFWDSIIHGARGIIYFPQRFNPGFAYDNTTPELAAEMAAQQNRVKSIEGALLSSIDPPTLGLSLGGKLVGTWRQYNGKSYFVVLNMSDQPATQTITLRGIGAAGTAQVNGENRGVALSGGAFSDTFAPYETHIYVV